jgi:hypothetical protein
METNRIPKVIFICPICGNATRRVPICGLFSTNRGAMYPIGLCIKCGPLNLELLTLCREATLETDRNWSKKNMEPGERIRTVKPIRSQRSGIMLPREGTFVSSTENLGRTLILVDFGQTGKEYLFPHEIETEKRNYS